MRNKQLVGGFVLAAMLSATMPLAAAHEGDSKMGGPKASACAMLVGMLMRMPHPDRVIAVFERISGCDLSEAGL
jgi:hypothetical protein